MKSSSDSSSSQFPTHPRPPIRLEGVRQNNLKNITVEFPAKKISVVTGLSGSGKSSLAFDTLYAEGQRRYVESLSTYTRQFLEKMPKPELDRITGIPPAIALEQRNSVLNSRSTVGTQTEIVDYLRVFFARVGRTYCPDCGEEVLKRDSQNLLIWSLRWLPGRKAVIAAPIAFGPPPSTTKKPQKKKTATPKKKKTSQPAAFSLQSLSTVLLGQGFSRLIDTQTGELVDLEDIQNTSLTGHALSQWTPERVQSSEIQVVVDRLRLTDSSEATEDSTVRSRLLDSIEQAQRVGQGRITFLDLDTRETQTFDGRFACRKCSREFREPEPHLFSFNSPIGACAHCSGFGHTLDLDENLIVPDPSKTLKNGAIDPFSKPSLSDWQNDLFRFCERNKISIGKRYRELTASERKLIWEGSPNDDTFPGILQCFEELKRYKYKLHIRVFIRRYQNQTLCRVCEGARLSSDALAVRVQKQNIADILSLPIARSLDWIRTVSLSPTERKIAEEVFQQVERRLAFLDEVGVGYLQLSRLTKTLSGGEYQRINLATQLGNGLCGTLYVLDEPSIGLHASDTQRLIGVLQRLRDQGNTVVVVEHDLDVMSHADWLVELGPGAGHRGGELVSQGTRDMLMQSPQSLTGKYLSGQAKLTRTRGDRGTPKKWLRLTGCRENNLKNAMAEFPLERFVVVTGVSGSGKSTLVHRILHDALAKLFGTATTQPGEYDRLYGAENLSGVVLLDQSPIGKSSRSNPATYLKIWDEVRKLYANQVIALRRGYTPAHFSFNVEGGRCPVCKGEGEITLDMHFMAEVQLPCEECEGRRFKKNILEVTYRGKNVHQLLQTTIDEAYDLFRENSVIARKLQLLRSVGLGYLQLGQSATTLSGGESQRLKIAATLEERSGENLLYIFDEPTTGLHLEDIRKLLEVLQDLVDSRQSVILIEHHMDVIHQADWIVDMGPGGGEFGGEVVGSAPPEQLRQNENSLTGKLLERYFPAPTPEVAENTTVT